MVYDRVKPLDVVLRMHIIRSHTQLIVIASIISTLSFFFLKKKKKKKKKSRNKLGVFLKRWDVIKFEIKIVFSTRFIT